MAATSTHAKGQKKQVLFFCVPNFAVYHALERCLTGHLPKDMRVAFLGNPLDDWQRFPRQWRSTLHTTSRLMLGWVLVNNFIVSVLIPAMEQNDIVVVEGFGLNAYLKAIAHHDCDRVLNYQSRIIEASLKDVGLPAPEYVLRHPANPRTEEAIAAYFTKLEGQKDPIWFGTEDTVEYICQALIDMIINERLRLPKVA